MQTWTQTLKQTHADNIQQTENKNSSYARPYVHGPLLIKLGCFQLINWNGCVCVCLVQLKLLCVSHTGVNTMYNMMEP